MTFDPRTAAILRTPIGTRTQEETIIPEKDRVALFDPSMWDDPVCMQCGTTDGVYVVQGPRLMCADCLERGKDEIWKSFEQEETMTDIIQIETLKDGSRIVTGIGPDLDINEESYARIIDEILRLAEIDFKEAHRKMAANDWSEIRGKWLAGMSE